MRISWSIFRYAWLDQFNTVTSRIILLICHKTLRFQSWLYPKLTSFSSLAIHSLWNKTFPGSWLQSPETHNIAHIKFILTPLKCQIYHWQRLLNGLGSYGTCLFRFSSYWGTYLRFALESWAVSDLVFMPKSSPKFKLVGLKVSKKDLFRKEQTIVIEKAKSNLCPISAMLIYLESHTPFPTSVPLFTFQSGFFLIWGRLTSETRLLLSKGGLDSSEFCCSQFSHRCSYDSCFKQCTPLVLNST